MKPTRKFLGMLRQLVLCSVILMLTFSCSEEDVKKKVYLLQSISVSAPGYNATYLYSYDTENRITYMKEVIGGSITYETFYTYQANTATMTNSDGQFFKMTFNNDGKLAKAEEFFNDEVVNSFIPQYTNGLLSRIVYPNESFLEFNYDIKLQNVTLVNSSYGWSTSYEYSENGLNPWNLLLQANPYNLILWGSAANPNELLSRNTVTSASYGSSYELTYDKRNLPVVSKNYYNGNQSGTLYFTYEVR